MSARTFPLFLGLIAGAAAVIAALMIGADRAEQWQLAARWTARVGFPILILTYAGSALFRRFPGQMTRTLLRNRRQLGLGFAIAHTIHLGALITFNVIIANTPSATALIGGGFAFAMMYVMALTSNDASMRALGKGWKWIHRVGIHALWAVFLFSYAGRIFEAESRVIGIAFTALALGALGLRLLPVKRASAIRANTAAGLSAD
jgi:methionine sulfoxide reductase heme-binding subunit